MNAHMYCTLVMTDGKFSSHKPGQNVFIFSDIFASFFLVFAVKLK